MSPSRLLRAFVLGTRISFSQGNTMELVPPMVALILKNFEQILCQSFGNTVF